MALYQFNIQRMFIFLVLVLALLSIHVRFELCCTCSWELCMGRVINDSNTYRFMLYSQLRAMIGETGTNGLSAPPRVRRETNCGGGSVSDRAQVWRWVTRSAGMGSRYRWGLAIPRGAPVQVSMAPLSYWGLRFDIPKVHYSESLTR